MADLVRQEAEYQQRLSSAFQLVPQVDWAGYVSARLRRTDSETLVAEKDGNLVGYIDIRVVEQGSVSRRSRIRAAARRLARPFRAEPIAIVQPRRYGFIEDIYVEPSMRGLGVGIGVKLWESSLRWFEKQKVREIEGAIWIGNEASQRFLRKLGFEPIRILMRKRL